MCPCGVGLNTGDLVLGNMGGAGKQTYTVLGSAVNLASRLCSAAKPTQILLTEVVLRAALEALPDGWEIMETRSLMGGEQDLSGVGGKIEGVHELPDNLRGKVISIGIVLGLTSVLMVLMLGLTRIVFAMSRDGLLPRALSHTSPRFGTPARLQVGTGIVVAVIAALSQVDLLEEMINIGTLSAFVLVSFGVVVLRRRRPDLPRGFRVPWSPVLPVVAGLACLWLMLNLTTLTWLRFLVWLVVGGVVYSTYPYRHSRLHLHGEPADQITVGG